MFEIDHDQIKPHKSALKVNGTLIAPREAVAALITLAPEPTSILTAATGEGPGLAGKVNWTILARYAGGVAIVTADTAKYVDWGAHGKVDVAVAANWVPLSSIEGVGLTDFHLRARQDSDAGALYGERSWVLHVRGLGTVRVPPSTSEDDMQAPWFAALQQDLSA